MVTYSGVVVPLAVRYADMVRALSTIAEEIKQPLDLEMLTGLLERANEVMLHENQDWRVVFRFQKLEPP